MIASGAASVPAVLRAVDRRFGEFKDALAELVCVPGVSAAGFPPDDLRRSAEVTAAVLRRLGIENVALLQLPGVPPYVYGDWLHASGAPTVLVYGHHDVVPPGRADKWTTPPFLPVEKKGRLYGRGTADDKGGFMAWVAAAAAYLGAAGGSPVNLRFLIEGEEETGSLNLPAFVKQHRDQLETDVLVLSDTYNFATGVPALTWQLRGLVQVDVEVTCLGRPVHSGDFGGAVPDAARILCRLVDDLRAEDGRIDVPGLYRDVVRPSAAVRKRLARLPFSEAAFRRGAGMLPGTRLERERGVGVYAQLWTRPSLTVIAIEAHPLHGAANQILDSARAQISLRTVPKMDARKAGQQLVRKLVEKPPAGAQVAARIVRTTPWWTSEPSGPAFEACLSALAKGYGRKPALIGSGASIGFVKPFADTLRVPCLLTGVEDPGCAAHSENESLHLGDFRKSMRSAVYLFDELGRLGLAGLARPSSRGRLRRRGRYSRGQGIGLELRRAGCEGVYDADALELLAGGQVLAQDEAAAHRLRRPHDEGVPEGKRATILERPRRLDQEGRVDGLKPVKERPHVGASLPRRQSRTQLSCDRDVVLLQDLAADSPAPRVPQERQPIAGPLLLRAHSRIARVDEHVRVNEDGSGHGARHATGRRRGSGFEASLRGNGAWRPDSRAPPASAASAGRRRGARRSCSPWPPSPAPSAEPLPRP